VDKLSVARDIVDGIDGTISVGMVIALLIHSMKITVNVIYRS
jgi:hypothetical protein